MGEVETFCNTLQLQQVIIYNYSNSCQQIVSIFTLYLFDALPSLKCFTVQYILLHSAIAIVNITALLLDLYYLHDIICQYVAINTFHVSCCSGFYCSVWKTWTPASANSTHDSSLSVANPLMSSQGSLRFQLTEYLHFSTVIIILRQDNISDL